MNGRNRCEPSTPLTLKEDDNRDVNEKCERQMQEQYGERSRPFIIDDAGKSLNRDFFTMQQHKDMFMKRESVITQFGVVMKDIYSRVSFEPAEIVYPLSLTDLETAVVKRFECKHIPPL